MDLKEEIFLTIFNKNMDRRNKSTYNYDYTEHDVATESWYEAGKIISFIKMNKMHEAPRAGYETLWSGSV
jgi:hypothetical protein